MNQQKEKKNNNQSKTRGKGSEVVHDSLWFRITKKDQYITVNELMSDNGDAFTYFFLLILSSIIISAGILLANSAIIIGGMLITPLLTPVLLIALGLTTGNMNLVHKSVIKISKSLLIIFVISMIISIIFSIPQDKEFFNFVWFTNTTDSAFLYFIVALTSGIAATFAWIRKKVDNLLPGIAIAVSLVPPVSMFGIFLGGAEFELARFFLMVFLFNLLGIIGGSMILFSMFRFYHSDRVVETNLEKQERARMSMLESNNLAVLNEQKKVINQAHKTIENLQRKINKTENNTDPVE